MGKPGLSESELEMVYREFDVTGSLVKTSVNTGIAKHRVVRAINHRNGKCGCGKPRDASGASCSHCLATAKVNSKNIHATRKAAHVCIYCAEPLSEKSTTFCEAHRLNNIAKSADLRKERISRGVCVDCEGALLPGSTRYCAEHSAYHIKAQKTKKMSGNWLPAIARDGGKCVICGGNETRLEVHHMDFNHANDELTNLITLCLPCHHALTDLVNCPDRDSLIEFVLLHYS